MKKRTFVTINIAKTADLAWSQDTELFFMAEGTAGISVSELSFQLHSGDLIAVNPFQLYSISHIEGLCLQLSLDLKAFAEYCSIGKIPSLALNTANSDPSLDTGYPQVLQLRKLIPPLILALTEPDTHFLSRGVMEPDAHSLLRKRAEFHLLSQLILYFSRPAAPHGNRE